MKKIILAMLMAFVLTGESRAGVGTDGNFWLEACTHKVLKDVTCTAFVFGLRGAFEMSFDHYKVPKSRHLYCAPDEVTLGQSIDVFVKFLKQNPEKRHLTARTLFTLAMRKAFPCK
jgi:hypothetical protein